MFVANSLNPVSTMRCAGSGCGLLRIELLRPCGLHNRPCFSGRSSSRQPVIYAQKGFGDSQAKGSSRRKQKPKRSGQDEGWYEVANAAEFEGGKQTKSVIMPGNKQAIVVYRTGDGEVYCSDANSTAYQFPLSNANLLPQKDGSAHVEVPLDGTIYELDTGKVVKWCPKNNPIRAVLGTLKRTQNPTDLKVYAAQEDADGRIFVQLG